MNDNSGIAGFSADTEILTRHLGWITFDRLTYADEVATRNPETKALEWQRPTARYAVPFKGALWRFASRAVDMLVAPGHPMLINPDQKPVKASRPDWTSADRFVPARKVAARVQQSGQNAMMGIPALSTWDAPDLDVFQFPPGARVHRREPMLPGDDFAAFMGMYLAEGCATPIGGGRRVILIAQQRKSKGFADYQALLVRTLGSSPVHGGGVFRLTWQALSDYLAPFGYAHEKWIPAEILDLSRRQLEIFWHFYMLGDGYKRSDDGREGIVTTSPRVADGMQEIVQKLGFSAAITTVQPTRDITWPDGRVTPAYRVRRVYVIKPRTSRVHKATRAASVEYDGIVHSVSVPNGVIYTRRNLRPAWAGA